MSLPNPFCHPQSSEAVFSDPLLSLEQECAALWSQEIQTYVQHVEPLVLNSPPAAVLPRHQRRKPRTPLRTPAKASRQPKTAKAAVVRRLPAPGLLKVAGISALALISTAAGVRALMQRQTAAEPLPIQQVMYQNAQTKVAAFRKEIEEGNHFVAEHSQAIQYVAREGDTIEKISKRFHVSPNTIIKNNEPSKIDDILEPGTKLTILPVDGIAHPVEKHETLAELSKRYDVGIQEIVDANELDNPHMITEKQKIIIPNATDLKARPKPQPVVQAIRNSRTGHAPTLVKTQTGRRLSWPSAGVVSSNFGWRWFRMHNGIDIAGPVGTPIKAAKEGRVVYSGWMGGYGYAIDIDHGNGIRTRYGHNSALKVAVGQYVHRGQMIATMGSTGHSTGPHLHFEVHQHGQPIDPRSYF